MLTIKELATKLNVKESWIRHMLFKKQIPFIKFSRLVRFDPIVIDQWISDRSKTSDLTNNGAKKTQTWIKNESL